MGECGLVGVEGRRGLAALVAAGVIGIRLVLGREADQRFRVLL